MNHQELIDLWCSAYEAKFGTKYVFAGGKDGRAVKALLASKVTPEEAVGYAKRAWNAPHTRAFWNCNTQSAQLHKFAAAYNSIVAELATTRPARTYEV